MSRRKERAARRKEQAPSRPGAAPFISRHGGDLTAALLAVPAILPFLMTGWFYGHDNMHLIRLFQQNVMLEAGQFPVRWYPDVAGGYGSPHPQFYAPIFYLIAQVFHSIGLSLAASLKATVIAATFASSIAMFRFAALFFGAGGGLVAAAAYTYAPYHMLDLFVRTALSELIVFLFLPLVLLAFLRLRESGGPGRIAAAAASLGALCLSHTITVMLIPPLIGGWILLLALGKEGHKRFILRSAVAGTLGIGLAAFFLIPLVAEARFVETEIYAQGYFEYGKHFAGFGQILSSPWGFGMSREGPGDGISFRLGFLHILGSVAALAGLGRLRRRLPAAVPPVAYAGALGLAGVFMALPVSGWIWALVPPLRFVQFPWRFLMLPAFATSLLCGAAAALPFIRERAKAALRRGSGPPVFLPRWVAALLCLFLVAAGVEMIGVKERIPIARIGYGGDHTDMRTRSAGEAAREPTVFTREFIRSRTLHWFDHVPKGGYPYPPDRDLARSKVEVARGRAVISTREAGPVRYRFDVDAQEPATIRLNVYRFPGWTWTIDGERADPAPPPGKRPVMMVQVPAGKHLVEARFIRTGPRWAGDLASLLSLGVVLFLSARSFRRVRARS